MHDPAWPVMCAPSYLGSETKTKPELNESSGAMSVMLRVGKAGDSGQGP